ncbi:MAG: uL15 family ribosomal protein [Candidatus Bilamarchaeaceae archaeon]
MAIRKRKAKRKGIYRGLKRHGGGDVKNRRGGGCHGGKGRGGIGKHKKTWAVKYEPGYFGKHGFARPGVPKKLAVLNLFEIENMVKHGELKPEGGKFNFQFEGKILGSGEFTHPVHIKAMCWSKKTEERVKKAGGSLTKIAEKPAYVPAKKPEKKAKKE